MSLKKSNGLDAKSTPKAREKQSGGLTENQNKSKLGHGAWNSRNKGQENYFRKEGEREKGSTTAM